ncbi:MAG: hypothetical protein HDR10_00200 [Lachnospiraceae bacterium]|nr:hypothetical protein [Lachnospiraceae bacterium]
MKIGEARQIYSNQLHQYQKQKLALAAQKKDVEKKMNRVPNGQELYADEAATLELSYQAVSEKYDEYHNFMEKLMEAHTALFNAEATKQQGEAMAEYAEDIVKLMEVARRISNGDIVPASDEKKLMEYDMELYMAAKNMAILSEREKEEHDSLWKDEEEGEPNPDPNDVANNGEVNFDAPSIEAPQEVIAAAVEGSAAE